jgi:hypothetical protein
MVRSRAADMVLMGHTRDERAVDQQAEPSDLGPLGAERPAPDSRLPCEPFLVGLEGLCDGAVGAGEPCRNYISAIAAGRCAGAVGRVAIHQRWRSLGSSNDRGLVGRFWDAAQGGGATVL